MPVLELLTLANGLEGTARAVSTPTVWLVVAMGGASLVIGDIVPLAGSPLGSGALWLLVLVAIAGSLLAALHLSRPRGPDDPPRRFVESYARAVVPLVVAHIGLIVAVGCAHSCIRGDGALGTRIFAGLGGLLALGGLAAAVHDVRRRL